MRAYEKLNQLALMQGGLFTAKQAQSCGYRHSNHHYYVKTGRWKKEGWGIYRFLHIPADEITFYYRILLWSCNRNGESEAVFSYETALSFYELSDVNPHRVSITVPKNFQKRSIPFKNLVIYKKNLSKKDIKSFNGLPVTTYLKTLLDIHEERHLSEDLIEQAVKEALQKGYITRSDIRKHFELARYTL